MPGTVMIGMLGTAGLVLGLASALTARSSVDRSVRALSWILVVNAAALTLLTPDPPSMDGERPCLQVRHCVMEPRIGPTAVTQPDASSP
jgi:hypothetical protein